jgi:hypothetical protein
MFKKQKELSTLYFIDEYNNDCNANLQSNRETEATMRRAVSCLAVEKHAKRKGGVMD